MKAHTKKPINFAKYPKRRCLTLHHCEICGGAIAWDHLYHDGGYGRRAHVCCVEQRAASKASLLPEGEK